MSLTGTETASMIVGSAITTTGVAIAATIGIVRGIAIMRGLITTGREDAFLSAQSGCASNA